MYPTGELASLEALRKNQTILRTGTNFQKGRVQKFNELLNNKLRSIPQYTVGLGTHEKQPRLPPPRSWLEMNTLYHVTYSDLQ